MVVVGRGRVARVARVGRRAGSCEGASAVGVALTCMMREAVSVSERATSAM